RDPAPVLPDAKQGPERARGVRAGDKRVLQDPGARGDGGQERAAGGAGVRGARGGKAVQRKPAGGRRPGAAAEHQGVCAACGGAEHAHGHVGEDVCGGSAAALDV
ncbi:hypothetical protein GGF38_002436, partial [Coemansia sp. RSA 25]